MSDHNIVDLQCIKQSTEYEHYLKEFIQSANFCWEDIFDKYFTLQKW